MKLHEAQESERLSVRPWWWRTIGAVSSEDRAHPCVAQVSGDFGLGTVRLLAPTSGPCGSDAGLRVSPIMRPPVISHCRELLLHFHFPTHTPAPNSWQKALQTAPSLLSGGFSFKWCMHSWAGRGAEQGALRAAQQMRRPPGTEASRWHPGLCHRAAPDWQVGRAWLLPPHTLIASETPLTGLTPVTHCSREKGGFPHGSKQHKIILMLTYLCLQFTRVSKQK